jgi:Ca2+-transporting ATPase
MTDNHDQSPDMGPRRQRAPTITIDTSAAGPTYSDATPLEQINPAMDNSNMSTSPELRNTTSFESRESRPISPHNYSSPTTKLNNGQNLLSVPGAPRSRGNSVDSVSEHGDFSSTGTYIASSQGDMLKGDLAPTEILNSEDALKPDPGTEADFVVENNKFAFTPGQLGKLHAQPRKIPFAAPSPNTAVVTHSCR